MALSLAGCGGDSDGTTGGSEGTTAPAGARPVSPNVDPAGSQQAIVDEFSACAEDAAYEVSEGPGVPGGVSVTLAGDSAASVVLATFVVFPDVASADIAAQRDASTVAGTGGGIVREGLTELVAREAADLAALTPCIRSAG